ncbi:MAG: hypothetical protein P0Y55_01680 [Candidatus Cohnella colombiensis]|uniref:Tyrosinase copper-binding domain-containing protein n=1 Tax=Candidatus Cohnella colombiensis TaxID=3121368 RepID=A0AA95F4Q0_9BACL|nr:MAG: hypothetical protein P0Y55_01680 [Cohnella sp.]
MSIIQNFPKQLLDEHMKWHHDRHNVNIENPPSGYGLEFLQFHRRYIAKVLRWYRQQGYDESLVTPWAAVPEPIRQSACYNQAAEARILYQPESFASADELGRFIEASDIHGCIHQEAANLFGQPDINDFDVAPRNTIFYNIHGMVDRWYQNWEGLGRFDSGLSYWCGNFTGAENEVLYYSQQDGIWWLGQQQLADDMHRTEVTAPDWVLVGDSTEIGTLDNRRPFRIWDIDGDGQLEVVMLHLGDRLWRVGKIKDGRLQWQPTRLEG